MRLLAIDTSSDACTVAAQDGATVASRHAEAAKEHTRLLLPMIREAMAEARLEYADLDAVVLGNGPGSFIGMRIAAAVAQGIAFAAGIRVVPVSSMAALALQALEEAGMSHAAIAQDAHMQEVYFGLYYRGQDGLVDVVGSERLAGQGSLVELTGLDGAACIAAGKGWQLYPELFAANRDRLETMSGLAVPDARYLVRLGEAALERGLAVDPVDVDPAYLRQKVASVPARKSP